MLPCTAMFLGSCEHREVTMQVKHYIRCNAAVGSQIKIMLPHFETVYISASIISCLSSKCYMESTIWSPPYIKLYLHCDITGYCKHLNAIKHSIKLSFIWCEEKQNRTDNCTTTHICITFLYCRLLTLIVLLDGRNSWDFSSNFIDLGPS